MLTKELSGLWNQLGNKLFVRELLESFMTWGLVIGVIGFMLALWLLKDRRAQVLALVLVVLSCASVYPVVRWRPKTRPDVQSAARWDAQTKHRSDYEWVWWSMGGLSIAALALMGRGKAGQITGIATAACGIAAVVYALWLHKEEIEVHHPEARWENRPPARPPPKTAASGAARSSA